MLARVSRRKLQRDVYKQRHHPPNDLYLPWLCPALYKQNQPSRWITTAARGDRSSALPRVLKRKCTATSPTPRVDQRRLASAAAVEQPFRHGDAIPFEHEAQYSPRKPLLGQAYADSSHGDSSWSALGPIQPIILKESLATAPVRFRHSQTITGDLNEIHQTLLACLQLGRLDRAVALLRRLNTIYKADDPGLMSAHSDYVREVAFRVVETKDQKILKSLQKWFEVDLKKAGVAADATIYTWMLKASLQESKPKKLERTIRRYINLADDAGLRYETMTMASRVLNGQELGRITQIAPTYHQIDTDLPHDPVLDVISQSMLEDRPRDPIDQENATGYLKPTDQKGVGLDHLKKALSALSDPESLPPLDSFGGTPEEKEQQLAFARQLRLEQDTFDSAIERWREESKHIRSMGIPTALSQRTVGAMMWDWHSALVPLIEDEIRKSIDAEKNKEISSTNHERCKYGPYLQFLSPEKLSAATILTTISIMNIEDHKERGLGPRLARVVQAIGVSIQDESIAEVLRTSKQNNYWRGLSGKNRLEQLITLVKSRQGYDSRNKLVARARASLEHSAIDKVQWTSDIKVKIGALLLYQLMNVAKMEVRAKDPVSGEEVQDIQPVLFHAQQYIAGRRVGIVRFNSAMATKLSKEPVDAWLSKHLPMTVEPRPWTSCQDGGFLYHKTDAVRVKDGDRQGRKYHMIAAERGDMDQVFKGLDVLGKTAWKINAEVFNVMLEAWNTGEPIASFPPEDPPRDYPPEPAFDSDRAVRARWLNQIKSIENEAQGYRTQRCFQNLQLEVARAYLNEKKIYFPHNVDFRGRAYPIPPFLNHMGADVCRGVLLFAEGKELGPVGLSWLKIQLANVYGFDKASFEERQKFADDHLADIYDSASNPMKGSRWWLHAEDPWQCLATCIELKGALESPDQTKFVSFLPVHQDGTCNGLQHYAALGGDHLGAQQVNLEPGDRPRDIYTGVADMIKKQISDEAAQGYDMAKALDGKITRKVVKQTVMTNVYGVTFVGAQRQVRKQLEEIPHLFEADSAINVASAAVYISRKIFSVLSTMFNGAHDIQYWLGDCAGRISEAITPEQIQWIQDSDKGIQQGQSFKRKPLRKGIKNEQTAFKSTVIWTTPLKMPVVQPYRKHSIRSVTTNLQRVSINAPSMSDPINKRKQLSAFPPNFIHSLDATHMILSALKCNELGLSFAAVHDSFWTHASNVDTMNQVLREAFVEMHSEDIIGRLASEFRTRYAGSFHLVHVWSSSVTGKKIVAWRKAHSKAPKAPKSPRQSHSLHDRQMKELLDEKRRLTLLASESPQERAEGQNMKTAGAIFAESATGKELPALEDLGGYGLGEMKGERKEADDLDDPEAGPQAGEDQSVEDGFDEAEMPLEDIDPEVVEDKPQKRAAVTRRIWLWLPLDFPPVPKKGTFDVSRLKKSLYFFS